MPLCLTKAIASKFTAIDDSNFRLVCNGRSYEVHTLVLREYKYFDTLLRGTWQEAKSGQWISYDDPKMFEAVVHYMYGAPLVDVLQCCCPLTGFSDVFDDLISANASLARFKTDALDAIRIMSGGKNFRLRRDPAPGFAQLMSVYCKQISQLYVVADQYCLEGLKSQLPHHIQTALSAAWNHSTILETFDLLLTSTQAEDLLNVWVIDQIKIRFFVLLREPQFTEFCTRVPQLQMAKKLALEGYMQQKTDKTLRYCHFAPCQRNVSTTTKRGVLYCAHCSQTGFIGPARTRMWPFEGDAEPEPEPEVKASSSRKRSRTTN